MNSITVPLDAEWLARALPEHSLHVREEVDSTQSELLRGASILPDRSITIAARQRCGRGRRGRVWLDLSGTHLFLSFLIQPPPSGRWPPLASLALGVAAAEALREVGAIDIGLKWPNDLWFDGRKLGGILVEATSGGALVAGIGINLHLPMDARSAIDQGCADLCEAGCHVSRESLAVSVVRHWNRALAELARCGWAAFIARWTALDLLVGRAVRVIPGNEPVMEGVAQGVDGQGRLLVQTAQGQRAFLSAEVSVRPA